MAAALQFRLNPVQDVPFLRTPGWSKQDVFRCSTGDAVIYDIGRRALDQVSRDPDIVGHFQRLIFTAPPLGGQHGIFDHMQGVYLKTVCSQGKYGIQRGVVMALRFAWQADDQVSAYRNTAFSCGDYRFLIFLEAMAAVHPLEGHVEG